MLSIVFPVCGRGCRRGCLFYTVILVPFISISWVVLKNCISEFQDLHYWWNASAILFGQLCFKIRRCVSLSFILLFIYLFYYYYHLL